MLLLLQDWIFGRSMRLICVGVTLGLTIFREPVYVYFG